MSAVESYLEVCLAVITLVYVSRIELLREFILFMFLLFKAAGQVVVFFFFFKSRTFIKTKKDPFSFYSCISDFLSRHNMTATNWICNVFRTACESNSNLKRNLKKISDFCVRMNKEK